MDGARDIFIVARTEVLGDGDARAHGRTDEEAREQHDERAGRADGGEGVRAEVLSHDESVGRAVKLLKDLTDEDGQRKAQDQGNGIPLGHVLDGSSSDSGRLCHGILSFPSRQRDDCALSDAAMSGEKGKAPRLRCFSPSSEETADKTLQYLDRLIISM